MPTINFCGFRFTIGYSYAMHMPSFMHTLYMYIECIILLLTLSACEARDEELQSLLVTFVCYIVTSGADVKTTTVIDTYLKLNV